MNQNELERIQDRLNLGLITPDEANVEMVKYQRVRLVVGRIPSSVRKSLNKAVKSGVLGHMKKDGYKPECYYFKPFEYMANNLRSEKHNEFLDWKSKTYGSIVDQSNGKS